MRTKLLVVFLASLAGIALASRARAQAPVFSNEFQANTTTASYQYAPSVASIGPASNFVVVWSSDGQDGSHTGAVGRLFDSAGTPLGGEFAINASTTGYQDRVQVGSNSAGNFVVAWTEFVDYDASYEVRARRFNSSGTPQGGDILVNTYTTGSQGASPVAMDSAGNFVVVWSSAPDFLTSQPPQDGDGAGIIARRFDANGNPLGAEFQVNQYTTGNQYSPRIAMNPGGDFIVVWTSDHQDAQASSIQARRYDNTGTPLGGEFRVNTHEANFQQEPDVALDTLGRAIVVWQSNQQDGSEMGVYGQRFDASGNKLGPEFNVNAFTASNQSKPRVVAGFAGFDPGEFAVLWHSNLEDGSDVGVYAQHFDFSGRRSSLELRVNEFTTGFQGYPALAAQPNGQYIAVWQSDGIDGSDLGIAARLSGVPRFVRGLVDHQHFGIGEGNSNLNDVLEVGEDVNVEYFVNNPTPNQMPLTGTASNFRGPLTLTYSIPDASADWGTIGDGGGNASCYETTGDCYRFSLTGTRPAVQHIDTAFDQTLSYNGFTRTSALHVGGSFADVASNSLFYPFIENLLHNGVTGGCAGGGYCPATNVTRAQMAVFLLKARWGAVFLPAPATGTAFPDVPASNPFARWIEELAREGVTGGCGGGLYCPDNPVTRQQMAVFLLKTLNGSTYVPDPCTGNFNDVPCPSQFADWIEDLAGQGITGGCSVSTLR